MIYLYIIIVRLVEYYSFILLFACLLMNLAAFGYIRPQQRIMFKIFQFLVVITQPLLEPIRRLLPNTGNIDISPIILYFILQAVPFCSAMGYVPIRYRSL